MQERLLIWGAVILCLGLIGCSDDDSGSVDENKLAGHTYNGVIPCADCEGIAYELTLMDDQQFESSLTYLGRSSRAYIERGSWAMVNDSVMALNGDSENNWKFKISNGPLKMLNQNEEEVTGSLAQMYVLNQADTTSTNQRWEKRRKQGVDFGATGNEPSWSLNIDFDKMMTFKTMGGDSINTPVPQMEKDTSGIVRTLNAETESASLKVELFPIGCMDNMSGEVFSYRVNVVQGEQTLTGCGNFINPKYELNDYWTLQTMNGTAVDSMQNTRQTPALQFDVANSKVYGNTGCNRLSGTITLEDSNLAFTQSVTTRMACPGDMEKKFTEALQQVERYNIANGELFLISRQDTLMTFLRAE